MSDKNKIFLTLFLGILVVFGGIFLWAYLTPRTTSRPTPTIPALPHEEKEATFFLSPSATSVAVGENFPLEIKFKGEGLVLSGATVRLTAKFEQVLPLEPQDADPQKEGNQAEINPDFLEEGWVYPINKVWVDWENKMIVAELAAVNPTVAGFVAVQEEILATIEFVAQAPVQGLIFEFDPIQTKLITKEGKEVKLNLEKGNYSTID